VSPQKESDRAGSPIIGVVLMIGITIILAMLLLFICLGFSLLQGEATVPTIFKITNVVHTNDYGKMTKASRVVLMNIGKRDYPNTFLSVKLFVNDIPADLELPSLNGYAAINLPHHGYKNVGGPGTGGGMYKSVAQWYSGQLININFRDGTFGPGDTIRLEVYDSRSGEIISRDTYPAPEKYTTQWFYNHFLNPQAA
jgi:flagellin-like protein